MVECGCVDVGQYVGGNGDDVANPVQLRLYRVVVVDQCAGTRKCFMYWRGVEWHISDFWEFFGVGGKEVFGYFGFLCNCAQNVDRFFGLVQDGGDIVTGKQIGRAHV